MVRLAAPAPAAKLQPTAAKVEANVGSLRCSGERELDPCPLPPLEMLNATAEAAAEKLVERR